VPSALQMRQATAVLPPTPAVPAVYRPGAASLVQAKSTLAGSTVVIQRAEPRRNNTKQEKDKARVAGEKKSKTRKEEQTVRNGLTYQSGGTRKEVRAFAAAGGKIPGHVSANSNSKQNSGTTKGITALNTFRASAAADNGAQQDAEAPVIVHVNLTSEELNARAYDVMADSGVDEAIKYLQKFKGTNLDAEAKELIAELKQFRT
jgi:hypothetical protein